MTIEQCQASIAITRPKEDFLKALDNYALALYLRKKISLDGDRLSIQCESLDVMNLIQGAHGIAIAAAAGEIGVRFIHFGAGNELERLAIEHTPESLRWLNIQLRNSVYD